MRLKPPHVNALVRSYSLCLYLLCSVCETKHMTRERKIFNRNTSLYVTNKRRRRKLKTRLPAIRPWPTCCAIQTCRPKFEYRPERPYCTTPREEWPAWGAINAPILGSKSQDFSESKDLSNNSGENFFVVVGVGKRNASQSWIINIKWENILFCFFCSRVVDNFLIN